MPAPIEARDTFRITPDTTYKRMPIPEQMHRKMKRRIKRDVGRK